MQKTTTFLMFVGDNFGKAEEAIQFYTSLFPNSEIKKIDYFKEGEPGGKEGAVKHATFTIDKQEYMAIDSLGHDFTFTPSVSIYVHCDNEDEINNLYSELLDGGKAMMPIGDYGFSKKFAWLADKYGLSWQLNFGTLSF
ncbi:VOC family protein [Agriterribacter humi]|uniref:VOC family protein n=1 Tax=Agriterribacter humi TaxID=1104781 RepID=UPI001D028CAE|nr:VOC family protein [Agriterribacter humi]